MSRDAIVSRRKFLSATGGTIGLGVIGTNAVASQENRVEYNVGYAAETGRKAAHDAASEVVREFAFDAVTVEIPERAVSELENRPDVRYVEENGEMQALAQEMPWGVDRINADVAHGDGNTGEGANVAIIDTGIEPSHEDLAGNLGKGTAIVECSESCEEPWDDDNGHGTHVAGTVAAVDNDLGVVGVAPDATVHAVKVLDSDGWGTYSEIAAGIEWTADQGLNVANLSLGGSSSSSTLKDASQYAESQGVLLVAAAGNDGDCTDCVSYPAAYEESIAVSATDGNDDLASFSSTGPEVELAAPGVSILSTYPSDDYVQFHGTSMAVPHVAAAGGLLMANEFSHTEARSQLNEAAEDIGLSENEQGSGLVDAGNVAQRSPSVTSGKPADVGENSASIPVDLDDLGGADEANVWVRYWDPDGNWEDTPRSHSPTSAATPSNSMASNRTRNTSIALGPTRQPARPPAATGKPSPPELATLYDSAVVRRVQSTTFYPFLRAGC